MLRTLISRNPLMPTIRQTALITGGTRGVGKEIADMFKKRGYNVIITGRDTNNAKLIAEEINKKYPDKDGIVQGYKLDFTNMAGSRKLLAKLEKGEIRPTYLINNAGVLMFDNMRNITEKHLDIMFKVNVMGPMYLTKLCIDDIWKHNYGAILFNSPPYRIDNKTKYLLPYMQTKLAQTTFMHSLSNSHMGSHIGSDKGSHMGSDVLVSSFWTKYPLMTDAIISRGIGNLEECMHPSILSRTIEELLFNTANRVYYNGKVILDDDFLKNQNIDVNQFKMGKDVPSLDSLFLKYLKNNRQ